MGVINLGLLVDKIKRKLESSGFIKNTDYASASKAGVVKIGSNVNVSSDGTISVAPPSGGMDLLYTQPAEPVAASTEITLAHAVSEYKFLLIVLNGTEDPVHAETMILSTEVSPYWALSNNAGGNGTNIHKFTIDGAKIRDTNSGNMYTLWFRVYGLK